MTANPEPRVCTECYDLFHDSRVYSQEALDDHLALHKLESLGKLIRVLPYTTFDCSECYRLHELNMLESLEQAKKHFEMHEKLMKTSEVFGNFSSLVTIHNTQLCCLTCYSLYRDEAMALDFKYPPDGPEMDLGQCYFNSISEFMQHFISEHMKTAPTVFEHVWTYNGNEYNIEHCSLCGHSSPEESHMCKCQVTYKKILQEIADRKSIRAFLVCCKMAKTNNDQSCLSSVDKLIINTIVEHMW